MKNRIFLSVGDLSGDIHCARLVAELLKRRPDLQIDALCGPHTREAGANQVGDTSGLGVIGFTSAVAVLPRSLSLKRAAQKWVGDNRPGLAILCDWGGFNTRFLPYLHDLNVPVLYYFPPRSWQKQGQGGLQIAKECQRIATPFPWSAQRLNEAGGHAEWVGHPILEELNSLPPREELRTTFGVAPDEKMLVALPGSRAMELQYIAPHVADACRLLARDGLKIFVAAAPDVADKLRTLFGPSVNIIEGQTLRLLRAADAAIVKSGTSTLEAAAANCPQVMVYEVPKLIRLQVTLTDFHRKVPLVAMPNIIRDKMFIPELLLHLCRGPIIAEATEKLLFDVSASSQMRTEYDHVRQALGADLPYTATGRTADIALALLNQ